MRYQAACPSGPTFSRFAGPSGKCFQGDERIKALAKDVDKVSGQSLLAGVRPGTFRLAVPDQRLTNDPMFHPGSLRLTSR